MRGKRDKSGEPQTCLYCGNEILAKSREHVIPEAFGKFQNNWTLHCVCAGCNGYFSKELEIPLSRDSFEAVQRIEKGVRPPQAADKLLNRRSEHRVETTGFFRGARVILGPSESGISPILQCQVGFRLPGNEEWTWVLERDLDADTVRPYLHGGYEIRIVGDEHLNSEAIVSRLRALGLRFEIHGRYSDPITDPSNSVEIEHIFHIDFPIQRAAAKICFNYAAWVLGDRPLRHGVFDSIRRFIRHGEPTDPHCVRAGRISLLHGEASAIEKVRGHLCSVGWRPETRELVANLSLFNELTYEVVLCTDPDTERPEFFVGHLFDLDTKRIVQLPYVVSD